MAIATPTPPAKPATPSGTPLIELQHMDDPLDRTLMRLATEHGDKVATMDDYPEWAAQFTTVEGDVR